MLTPGTCIHIVAPSGAVDVERVEAGAAVLRSWGYAVEVAPEIRARERYLAGADAVRLRSLRAAADRALLTAGAVWMARGGYGLSRLLPELLHRPLPSVPFIGFSDGTVLLNHHRGVALHAPVVNSLIGHADRESLVHLRRVLGGEVPPLQGTLWVGGEAEGRLAGGNLCVLASLAGTPGAFRGSGCIVALEDTGEAPYKVDRLLTQLIQSGAFLGVRGFALGTFDNGPGGEVGARTDAERDATREVLLERLSGFGVPILGELPFGHGRANRAFRFGPARIIEDRLVWG